jgi:hypothetical protein
VAYAIYLPDGATTNITLPAGQTYSVKWFNPRTGGSLVSGTVGTVSGTASVGKPPTDQSRDWVALLRRSGGTSTSTSTATSSSSTSTTTALAVTKFSLINASKQTTLRSLSNGSTIDLSTDGSALNVRADVSGTVGSVAFLLDGKLVRTENSAVYALAGDNSGVYLKWTPSVGSHTLSAIPYSADNRGGSMGPAYTTTFTVQN